MQLFKSNLFIILFILSSIVSIKCQSNDTEITTLDSLIDNEDHSEEDNSNAEPKELKDQSVTPSSTTSTTAAKTEKVEKNEGTQPTINDDIKEDNPSANNKEESELNSNNEDDSSLFSVSPGASSSSPLDKSANEDKLTNENESNDEEGDSDSNASPSSSTEAPKTSDQPKSSTTSKASYEECVALGNENCGTPPDDDSDSSDEKEKDFSNLKNVKPDDQAKSSDKPSGQENSDQSNAEESKEQKTKNWYDEIPLKLGLPFVLVLFVLFVIIFLLFLIFLIQDSFSRNAEDGANNETIKIKTGAGTQKFNLNQLQMLEKRMRAARDDVDLTEVNVQSFNNKKDDSDDQNNNVPNENAFENIALQDKNSSRM